MSSGQSPLADPETIREIRKSVASLCAGFPGEYWRGLDREKAYPAAFVQAMTEGGFLGVLIPEEYGGSGQGLTVAANILEEVHAQGCNAADLHAQMYTMGTLLRHGSEAQKNLWLPKIAIGEVRLQAFGVTEPTAGTDTTSLRTSPSLLWNSLWFGHEPFQTFTVAEDAMQPPKVDFGKPAPAQK